MNQLKRIFGPPISTVTGQPIQEGIDPRIGNYLARTQAGLGALGQNVLNNIAPWRSQESQSMLPLPGESKRNYLNYLRDMEGSVMGETLPWRLAQIDNIKSSILRDAIGQIQPKISIIKFGSKYGKGGFYSISSTAKFDRPTKFDTFETALKWAKDNGFQVAQIGRDGYGKPIAHLQHTASMERYNAIKSESNIAWESGKEVFVRYGRSPKSGKSFNVATGEYEKGVSAFRGRLLPNGEVMVKPQYDIDTASFHALSKTTNRPIYIIEGKEIGIGSDGEPILSNVRQFTPQEYLKRIEKIKP